MQNILDKSMFDAAIQNGAPTVMLWYTTWCPDCHRIEPFMPEVEKEYGDRFQFVSVDRDKFPEEATQYQVIGIPSFIVFQNGQIVDSFISRHGKSRDEIESFLTAAYRKLA